MAWHEGQSIRRRFKRIPTWQNHTGCLQPVIHRWDWFNRTACYYSHLLDLMVKKPEDWPITLVDGASKTEFAFGMLCHFVSFPARKDLIRLTIYSHLCPEVKWAGGSPRLYDGKASARAGVAGILREKAWPRKRQWSKLIRCLIFCRRWFPPVAI